MDWKEQLSTVVRESEIQFLDVRFICTKQQEQWSLKRFRVTVFHTESSLPERVEYPSFLFLRQKMRVTDFLQLIDSLATSPQAEEKPRTFSVNGQEICFQSVGINFNDHTRGKTFWGLMDRPLPTWNFGGNIWPETPENQEPLVAQDAPYFPMPLDGQAWFLYEKARDPSNNYLPSIEITLEDARAFFQDVDIKDKASTVVCKCAGTMLAKTTLRLYTNTSQLEEKPARPEVIFHLQGDPTLISLALTYNDIWLDRYERNSTYQSYDPLDIFSLTHHSTQIRDIDVSPTVEAIARSDSSDLAATAGPHLVLSERFYNNVLEQSKRSFLWAIIGFVLDFILVAVAIGFLIFRPLGDTTALAAIITAIGGISSAILSGFLLNFHKAAADQAAKSQVNLDRIQRFFIALTEISRLNEKGKDETRIALLKKLNDM